MVLLTYWARQCSAAKVDVEFLSWWLCHALVALCRSLLSIAPIRAELLHGCGELGRKSFIQRLWGTSRRDGRSSSRWDFPPGYVCSYHEMSNWCQTNVTGLVYESESLKVNGVNTRGTAVTWIKVWDGPGVPVWGLGQSCCEDISAVSITTSVWLPRWTSLEEKVWLHMMGTLQNKPEIASWSPYKPLEGLLEVERELFLAWSVGSGGRQCMQGLSDNLKLLIWQACHQGPGAGI